MSYAIDWMTALSYLNSDTTNAFGKLTLTDTCLLSKSGAHFDEMVVTQTTDGLYERMRGFEKAVLQVDGLRVCKSWPRKKFGVRLPFLTTI